MARSSGTPIVSSVRALGAARRRAAVMVM
uniref:Uncharacterized protein n=1 Tax=Arundo donax TaxID=35708 RepID=A0A0A8Z7A9_ARUDO